MKYSYFPGCSLHSMASEYEHSTRSVCNKLGIELLEIPDWNCCGASSAHSTDHLAGVAIPARNLAIAETKGLDVVTPCAACYQRLAAANYEMETTKGLRDKVNQVTGRNYQGKTKVLSIIEPMLNYGLDKISAKVVKPLKDLKVACYYGCYFVKPPKFAKVDDAEYPQTLDNIMKAIGAEAVEWPYKTECCGGSLLMSNPEIVLKLVNDITRMAVEAGANAIVTACPLCQPNLDTRQAQSNKMFGTNFDIPIFYFTELMDLALGTEKYNMELNKHFVYPNKVLEKYY